MALVTQDGLTQGIRDSHFEIVVAASDAPLSAKAGAQFVCDGTADDVQIQAAHDLIAATGSGTIRLSAGTFYISATINLTNRVMMCGTGSDHTTLYLANAANCDMIKLMPFDPTTGGFYTTNALSMFRDFRMHGNRTNQSAWNGTTNPLRGIVQMPSTTGPTKNAWIDIQFVNIWFSSMAGSAIELCQQWEHRVLQCVFEQSTGAAVYFNIPSGQICGPIWISECFAIDNAGPFIDCTVNGTVGNAGYLSGLYVRSNHVGQSTATISDHLIHVPPSVNVTFSDNNFYPKFTAANTYDTVYLDNQASSTANGYSFTGNRFTYTANVPRYALHFVTAYPQTMGMITITGNLLNGAGTDLIRFNDATANFDGAIVYLTVTGNVMAGSPNGIYFYGGGHAVIEGNNSECSVSFAAVSTYVTQGVITGNRWNTAPTTIGSAFSPAMQVFNNAGPEATHTYNAQATTALDGRHLGLITVSNTVDIVVFLQDTFNANRDMSGRRITFKKISADAKKLIIVPYWAAKNSNTPVTDAGGGSVCTVGATFAAALAGDKVAIGQKANIQAGVYAIASVNTGAGTITLTTNAVLAAAGNQTGCLVALLPPLATCSIEGAGSFEAIDALGDTVTLECDGIGTGCVWRIVSKIIA